MTPIVAVVTRRSIALALAAALLLGAAGSCALGWQLSRPVPVSIGPPPPDLDAVPVTFRSDSGLPIHGWLSRGAPGRGAVLLLPAVRTNRLSMVDRARFLRAAGYTTLAIDLQATGESPGDRITFGWRERLDVLAAVRLLKEKAAGERVAVLGTSLGGAAALFAAPELEADAVILEAVYPSLDAAVENRLRIRVGGLAAAFSPLLLAQVRPTVGVWPSALKPVDRIGLLRCPVLVIGGTRDQHTTAADTRRLFDAARMPKELWMIEGADHADFLRTRGEEYQKRVLGFLGSVLRGEGRFAQASAPILSDTAAIYAAVLGGSFHAVRGGRFVVVDRTIAMPAIGDRMAGEFRAARMPESLLDADRRKSAADQPLDSSLPGGTRLVAKARIDSLVAAPDEAGWSRFQQELAAAGWLSLSAVVISPDRLDALVAYDAHCGGLCGEGGYAWVRWNESANRWILVRTFARWVS
jgi:fermentation-respiration switch protein FrsA (DUF1100 family)